MNNKPSTFEFLLLLSVFVVATCGIIYELVAGTLASYLLGDSVTQFSTIIGAYLFAMGVGSWFSKFLKGNLLAWFVRIEIMVGIVGGCSAAMLFILFEQIVYFRVLLYTQVLLTGILVGLELPLLMRILKDRLEFTDLVSKIFTFDYIGALIASLLFPLIMIPYLGLMRTSFFFGTLNIIVALIVLYKFKNDLRSFRSLYWSAWIGILIMISGVLASGKLTDFAETLTYADAVVYAKSTPYQRIVITRSHNDWRLYLNGNLQFSSADEYRYHEALVHPAMSRIDNPTSALILGGGDGMAAREILKYPSIKTVDLVDLDRDMTDLFTRNEGLLKLNASSLQSPKVSVHNEDAFQWIRRKEGTFDFAAVDFPDPANYSLGKLYTVSFYRELHKVMKDDGMVVVQATSPYVAKESFWIINESIRQAGFKTMPYHCHVPSFGEWGFILAVKTNSLNLPDELTNLPGGLRFIEKDSWPVLANFSPDMKVTKSPYNTLNNQVLVNTFDREWAVYSK
ncbi:MAG TPA: polyamine aminopropyltransferase [Cyclobacteriaceae bacterium]|nr:polyamine aminopropyltransferase [Cyclobacteriaceae bacterium]